MRLLDLFCGAGGAGYGYHQAGFEVVGVDINVQASYPFEMHQADALAVLDSLLSRGTWSGYTLSSFAAIHASPPCQHYTNMLNFDERHKESHPDLVAVVRKKLKQTGLPYIIENVVGAPIENPIMLCGAMFGLRVYRHRLFESNNFLFGLHHPKHLIKAAKASRIPKNGEFWSPVGCFGQKDDAQRAMGIHWMKTTGSRDREIAEAIPPAYTKFLGEQLMSVILASEVSA